MREKDNMLFINYEDFKDMYRLFYSIWTKNEMTWGLVWKFLFLWFSYVYECYKNYLKTPLKHI